MPDYDLDNAYEIDGPESAKELYGNWAETYDSSFGEGWGYVAPRRIAELYLAGKRRQRPDPRHRRRDRARGGTPEG